MKKAREDSLRAEYRRGDLGRGRRGKFFKAYQASDHLVLLSADVAEVFPDDESVNEALRSLIKVAHRVKRPARRTGRASASRRPMGSP